MRNKSWLSAVVGTHSSLSGQITLAFVGYWSSDVYGLHWNSQMHVCFLGDELQICQVGRGVLQET